MQILFYLGVDSEPPTCGIIAAVLALTRPPKIVRHAHALARTLPVFWKKFWKVSVLEANFVLRYAN